MAINIGLNQLYKSKTSETTDLSPTRLEITDAIGESVRIYMKNTRLEFTVEDFIGFSDEIEKGDKKLSLVNDTKTRGAQEEIVKSKLYNLLRNYYINNDFLKQNDLAAKIRNYITTNHKPNKNNKDLGLVELSRPFYERIFKELESLGTVIHLRKYEALPYATIGDDLDVYTDIPVEGLEEIFSKYGFHCQRQYSESHCKLLHIHFRKFSQHFDFSYKISFTENSALDFELAKDKVIKNGLWTLSLAGELYHVVDSIVHKYKSHIPNYYRAKFSIINENMLDSDWLQFEKYLMFLDEEHKHAIINMVDNLKSICILNESNV